jgi:HAD superfamily hydrolase (TIGR01484 family)
MLELIGWDKKSDPHFLERSVFCFDLDETLTIHGKLSPIVLDSLLALQEKNIKTVIVSGRPAGWADALIKLLPVDAMISESGACIFRQDRNSKGKAPEILFADNSGYQASMTTQLGSKDPRFQEIFQEAKKLFPKLRIAADQFGRLFDFAIDFAEFIQPPLSFLEADKIRLIYEKHGATAKVSSIHVNGWYGSFSKFTALEHLVNKIWKMNLQRNVVYFGDSPNDGALFEKVDLSIGVRNIEDFSKLNFVRPKFISRGREGDGVAESIRHYLSLLA